MLHLDDLLARGPITALLGVLFLLAGCSSGGGDESTGITDCDSYVHTMSRCMKGVGLDVVSKNVTNARQTFIAAAKDKDPASLDRLSAKCRAAEQQLAHACR